MLVSQMFLFQYTIYDILSIGSFGFRISYFRTDHDSLKTAGQDMEKLSLQKSINLKIIEARRQKISFLVLKVISRIKTKKL